jgi:hypothetical protein
MKSPVKTERYRIGPFHFTFANGRLWASYGSKSWGNRLIYKVKPIPADMTLVMHLHWFLTCRRTGDRYMTDFVRYYFPDIPDIQQDAERQETVALAMPDYDYRVWSVS